MIVLPSKNSVGQVIHVIYGPESEFFMDVHGAKIVDITNIVSALTAGEKVFLSLTRTRSEKNCVNVINSLGILFTFSFDSVNVAMIPPSPIIDNSVSPNLTNTATVLSSLNSLNKNENFVENTAKSNVKIDKCDFCGNMKELLPLASINVCSTCALIDLKRILNERKNNL